METILDKASENASETGLGDDDGSILIAEYYPHRLQLPAACTL